MVLGCCANRKATVLKAIVCAPLSPGGDLFSCPSPIKIYSRTSPHSSLDELDLNTLS